MGRCALSPYARLECFDVVTDYPPAIGADLAL
jgi:hypothetical protein